MGFGPATASIASKTLTAPLQPTPRVRSALPLLPAPAEEATMAASVKALENRTQENPRGKGQGG